MTRNWSKEFFVSRVQALEEELAKAKEDDRKARAFVDTINEYNAGLEEDVKNLRLATESLKGQLADAELRYNNSIETNLDLKEENNNLKGALDMVDRELPKINDLEEENKLLQDELAAYRVTSKAQSDSYIELQERLSVAEEVINMLWTAMPLPMPKLEPDFEKRLERAIEKYNSLKK